MPKIGEKASIPVERKHATKEEVANRFPGPTYTPGETHTTQIAPGSRSGSLADLNPEGAITNALKNGSL